LTYSLDRYKDEEGTDIGEYSDNRYQLRGEKSSHHFRRPHLIKK
jgi:hypothetical protein